MEFKSYNDLRQELKKHHALGTLTFLGLISDGDQGLVTGNNSKYLGVIGTDEDKTTGIEYEALGTQRG